MPGLGERCRSMKSELTCAVQCRYAEELRHRKEAVEEEDEEVDDKLEEPSARR